MTREPKMLPCPFCGHHAEIEPWHDGVTHMVSCGAENCHVTPRTTGETRLEAIKNWNRRTP